MIQSTEKTLITTAKGIMSIEDSVKRGYTQPISANFTYTLKNVASIKGYANTFSKKTYEKLLKLEQLSRLGA